MFDFFKGFFSIKFLLKPPGRRRDGCWRLATWSRPRHPALTPTQTDQCCSFAVSSPFWLSFVDSTPK